MKKYFLTFLSLFTSVALAEEYPTMDIINNSSSIPITVTYNECQSDRAPGDLDGQTLYNCTEKTSVLRKKGSGANFIRYPGRKENNQNPNFWILKKIASSLGEQNFIYFSSIDEYNELSRDETKFAKICDALIDVWGYGTVNKTMILENFGTDKFYCHHVPY